MTTHYPYKIENVLESAKKARHPDSLQTRKWQEIITKNATSFEERLSALEELERVLEKK